MFNTIESVLCLTVPRNGGSIYLPKHLEIQLWRRKPQLPSCFLFFLKEYHINMQSHLKFFYIELPGWLNSAAAEEINLPSLILNKKLGGRMKNSDGVAVVW